MNTLRFILCVALFAAVSCEKNQDDSSNTTITGEAKDITCTQEEISGQVILPAGKTKDTHFGVLYSTSNILLYGSATNVVVEEYDSNSKFNLKISGLKPETTYYYRTYIYQDGNLTYGGVQSFTTKSLPEGPVDLGLTVMWASCNVGASEPTKYGKYFAWGDVEGQTWDGSSWSGGGFSTYPQIMVDMDSNLVPKYDAAYVNLGDPWRMPTFDEQNELVNNCTSSWMILNGVTGRLFTSNSTNQSIFLPAAGYGRDENMFAGSGFYWSSYKNDYYYSWYLFFNSNNVKLDVIDRACGLPVRPVYCQQ